MFLMTILNMLLILPLMNLPNVLEICKILPLLIVKTNILIKPPYLVRTPMSVLHLRLINKTLITYNYFVDMKKILQLLHYVRLLLIINACEPCEHYTVHVYNVIN